MQLFYTEKISQHLILPKEESRHLIQVLRREVGDQIWFTDGKGTKALYEIVQAHPKHCDLRLVEQNTYKKSNPELTIGIAPTKNMDRLEWFVEKAVEIGVDKIILFFSEHSERRKVRLDRVEKIAIAAMKQSQQFFLPEIPEPMKLEDLLKIDYAGDRFLCHQEDGKSNHLSSVLSSDSDRLILIGPEGDFSPNELNSAKEKGFKPVELGPNRLRTETAGVAACQICSTFNSRN